MATIKSFTDISQGRKLAEILPLESADMCCFQNQNGDINYYGFPFLQGNKDCNPIPCWSLSALLGVLPDYTLQTNTDGTVFVVCDSKKPMISDAYDNPVDACVAMIEKLNELNLL